jgi:hypothetical protein
MLKHTNLVKPGTFWLREDGSVVGPASECSEWPGYYWLSGYRYHAAGITSIYARTPEEVWPVPTDPAEVVAELRERSEVESKSGRFSYDTKEAYHDGREQAYESAADLVAERIGEKE